MSAGQKYFLDDQLFQAFQEYIYALTGINYTQNKRYLLDMRIKRRVRESGFRDGASYLEFLQKSAGARREIEALIDQVTTNETSFFRHERQIEIFGEIVSGLLAARRAAGPRRLKIWSAACSSGEEAYTLAMVVHRLLEGEAGWDISILGTDISPPMIARAQKAVYDERSLRGLPEPYLSRYIQPDPAAPQQRLISPRLTEWVEFRLLSLIDEGQMRFVRDMDIVFCRNVLIYFDPATKKKVVELLWESLRPGGYLVLGPSDSLHGLSARFGRTPHSAYNFFQRPQEDPAAGAPPLPAASPATSSAARGAVPAAQRARIKTLVTRLDMGMKELNRDLDASLDKIIEGTGTVAEIVERAARAREWNRPLAAELSRAGRQLARILLFLQVGDRSSQKIEALRALLQELSDRLFSTDKEAPDLRVRTSTFDKSILEGAEGAKEREGAGESLSQHEIDALFE